MDYLERSHYRFYCTVKNGASLPAFLGPMLRGAYGNKLRQVVGCQRHEQACPECGRRFNCAYVAVFKPSLVFKPPKEDGQPQNEDSHQSQLPQPFAIAIDSPGFAEGFRSYETGGAVVASLALFGSMSNFFASQAIIAMMLALDDKFTHNDLLEVGHVANVLDDMRPVYADGYFCNGLSTVEPLPEQRSGQAGVVRVSMLSPLHILEKAAGLGTGLGGRADVHLNDGLEASPSPAAGLGQKSKIPKRLVERPTAEQILRAVFLRRRMLVDCFGYSCAQDGQPTKYCGYSENDAGRLIGQYGITATDAQFSTVATAALASKSPADARASQKQGKGVVGGLTLSGDLGALMPYLEFAELAHIGQLSTFGYGAVKVEAL